MNRKSKTKSIVALIDCILCPTVGAKILALSTTWRGTGKSGVDDRHPSPSHMLYYTSRQRWRSLCGKFGASECPNINAIYPLTLCRDAKYLRIQFCQCCSIGKVNEVKCAPVP